MQLPVNRLKVRRDLSLDAFRGLTFLVMIFVNQVAGVSDIPDGIKHMAANVDGMSLADIVFPCFLFIVGMSIPFGINSRIQKGDSLLKLQSHVLYRAFGLIVMGFYMVNTEAGYNEKAMGFSIELWALAFYAAVMLVWGVYKFRSPLLNHTLRAIGIITIIVLGALYRSGDDGHGWMVPEWWGILGCIGWAYLGVSLLYQLARGRVAVLIGMVMACVAWFWISRVNEFNEVISMHVTHSSIVLCGLICSLLFFDEDRRSQARQRIIDALWFAAGLAAAGFVTHRFWIISKIDATPPWALYCSAIAVAIFIGLYALINLYHHEKWLVVVEPAASNPLITYLIPHVMNCLMRYFGLVWPALFMKGTSGLSFGVFFSFALIYVVGIMNRYNLKLKL